MLKKKIITIGIALLLIMVTTFSVFANSAGVKMENSFQLAKKDEDITLIKANEDFKYTDFNLMNTSESHNNIESDVYSDGIYNNSIEVEADIISSNPKINIYNKMLNTIDNFNNLTLSLETSMLDDDVTTIEYQIDINSNLSYQLLSEDEQAKSEIYSQANNMIFVDNVERTYMQNYLPTYTREDTPYIPLEARITTGGDGIPCYLYRRNVTNCPLASYSVFPQEITYSYLKDFDKWEIEDDSEAYLGRNCIRIAGTPSPYIATKHNIDSFTMLVDSETGILLDFHGTLNGNVSRYMTVTECTFESRAIIKQFDLTDYGAYTEVQR